MTAYLAGLALLRCDEHDRSTEIDSTARLTLVAMASFVGKGARHDVDPQCVAAQATIARRAALSVRSVIRAQERLADLGLVERDGRTGEGLRCTVRWRLLLVTVSDKGSDPLADKNAAPTGGDTLADKGSDTLADKGSDTVSDNPLDSYRPPGREGGERSDAAIAAASAGATAAAAAPSTESGLVGEVREALGCSAEFAEKWITDRCAAATGPVRNLTAFIRKCLAADSAAPASKSTGGRSTKSGPARKPSPGPRKPRLRGIVPAAEERAAIAASRDGEPHDSIAERMRVKVGRVDQWRKFADRNEACVAVDQGGDPEAVASSFGVDISLLHSHRRRRCERTAVAALRRGVDPGQVATDSSTALGEPITADMVRAWLDKYDESKRRLAAVGIAS